MPMAIAYWVLMLLLLVFGLVYVSPAQFVFAVNFVIVFLILLLIGWKLFGRPVQ